MHRVAALHHRRVLSLVVLLALFAGFAVTFVAHAGRASAATPTSARQSTSKQSQKATARQKQIAASESQPRSWGVANDELPWSTSGMQDLSAVTGRNPGVVMWYVAWSLKSDFPAADASRVHSWGATPEITWEPWDPSAGVNQPDYSLANITAGNFDSYLTSWARAAKTWGHPLRIRFAHEMNGNWYPWAQGVNGNGAGSYVAAWRHVVSVFRKVGADNVTWVWSPNVPYPGSSSLAASFPGDAWVGQVALDGYNWGTTQGGQWTSFADVFGPGITQLSKLSTRPIGIGEVGCPEDGGDKAAWMDSMWKTLAGWPRVRTLNWFDYDKEADWRINSSTSSTTAFRSGLSGFVSA